MQPLDAIGPHEVFAGATTVLAAKGRKAAGYDLALVSRHGTPITSESGLLIGTTTLPMARTKIDTLLIPGGDGSRSRPIRPRVDRTGSAAPRTPQSPDRHGLHGHVHRRRGRTARWPNRDHPLGASTAVGRRVPTPHGRSRSDLPPRRSRVDLCRCHRRHRSRSGNGRGRLRQRHRPDRGALDGDVPASSRRTDSVRRTGVGAPRRPLDCSRRRRTTSTPIRRPTTDSISSPAERQ